MKLKDFIKNVPKERVYQFYSKITDEPKDYDRVTRASMYDAIIKTYKENPEIISRLSTSEELSILKNIIMNPVSSNKSNSYIDYLLFSNLKKNFLIYAEEDYYIFEDLINYVKMALNLTNEKEDFFRDITDSAILGLIRIFNVVEIEEYLQELSKYNIIMNKKAFKSYILKNPKLKDKIDVVKYQNKTYVISLEEPFYKEVLKICSSVYKRPRLTLEELISYGKYKINLFDEKIINLLSYLELNYKSVYIDYIIDFMIEYKGLDLNSEETIKLVTSDEEIISKMKEALPLFPMWVYNGNNINTLDENIILPNKDEECICGSGKKFKNCCMKKYK